LTHAARQARLLRAAAALNASGVARHFGGSGEATVTAALGGTIQPMRGSLRGMALPPEFEAYATGPRRRQSRDDEVRRLLSWAKLAPPFGGGVQRAAGGTARPDQLEACTEKLEDSWTFAEADDAAVIGHHLAGRTVAQAAPARVSRGGLPLPQVAGVPAATAPFVVTTRFPTGAVSVTAIGRTAPGAFVEAEANVTQAIGAPPDARSVIGVFGAFARLALTFAAPPAGDGLRVWAQDLLGTTPAHDVTDEVRWQRAPGGAVGASLALAAETIRRVGLEGRSAGDVSPPGLVVRFSTDASSD
jgi:hypothetical protein